MKPTQANRLRKSFAILPTLALLMAAYAPTAQAAGGSGIAKKVQGLCYYERQDVNYKWSWAISEEVPVLGPGQVYCPGNAPGEPLGNLVKSPIITNNSTDYSVWITIYDLAETRQMDWGCVQAHNLARWNSGDYLYGSTFRIRAELKKNKDCTGDTFFGTTYSTTIYMNNDTNISTLQSHGSGYYWAQGNGGAGPDHVLKLPINSVVIHSRVSGDMALSFDKNDPNCQRGAADYLCKVTLRNYVPGDPSQVWSRDYQDVGMTFKNKFNGMLLWAHPGQGQIATLVNGIVDFGSKWTLAGDCASDCALRPLRDAAQNLNVYSNGPYPEGSPVGTWDWANGQVNETWFLTDSDAAVPSVPFVIHSRIDTKVLSIDKTNANCVAGGAEYKCPVVIDDFRSGDAAQIWDRRLLVDTYVFKNRATGMVLYVGGGNGAVATLARDNHVDQGSAWNFGGDCASNCTLRPARDGGQNLNVFGNGPYIVGSRVGTWEWGGGGGNETWYLIKQ